MASAPTNLKSNNQRDTMSGTAAPARGLATNGKVNRVADSLPENHKSSAEHVRNENTGFTEPFSLLSNTTLRHQDAITDTNEDLSTIVSRQKKHHPTFHHKQAKDVADIEKEMYKDLQVADAGEVEKAQQGKLKRALHKLPCTH
jgi:hypothetical protein